MARYRGAVCRLCRRENIKMFLKGDRCFSDKCAFERRSFPPGQHGQGRAKFSDYGLQLREKQKTRRIYGILEKQFRGYYYKADAIKGVTGANLLELLERRLDNVVYKSGFAVSLAQARQLVRHIHFLVNGKKVNIPSFLVKPGDVIELKEKSRKIQFINESIEAVPRRGIPQWLELEKEQYKVSVKQNPLRDDITIPIQEQLIVELYSK